MSREESIKFCIKMLIEKIKANIEYMTSVNVGLNYDSKYVSGKIDALCEVTSSLSELYSLLWEENK